ncbi:toll-like receptor 6 [Tiliqua scincoides]|uniref:toll-like receptor 6 n=1 Tax=Tiliqua scincoides TaxID=71010 RepID=UPI0034619C57
MVLDLSHNTISKLHISDFRYLSKLQVLILTHNRIRQLDFSVFQYNEDLEHIDLSHNNLRTLSCYPVRRLRYLDLSYNDYTAMPVCPEFSRMLQLEHLGLSARRIQKSDFNVLSRLQLDSLFLDLENLSEYSPGHLLMFNTKSLRIVLPTNTEFPVVLDLMLMVTESLELSNIQGKQVNDLKIFLLKLNRNSALLNLTLSNAQGSLGDFANVLWAIRKSAIEYLTIYNATEVEDVPYKDELVSKPLKVLTIKHFKSQVFIRESSPYDTFSTLNIEALTVSDAGLIHFNCPIKSSHYIYLCLSYNSLTDLVYENCNNLTFLETLILQKNQFKKLIKVSAMTSHMKSLKYLDMSHNLLQYEDNENTCHWGGNLIKLNLSFNKLSESVFKCLPVNIQMLDLQDNQISNIPGEIVELDALEEINLASNKLADLPGCGQFRNLRLMNIEMNTIVSPSSEFYQTCQSIKMLKAGLNPFMCSCEIRQFINLEKQGALKLIGWPSSYVCQYPENLSGIQLKDIHVSEIFCNTALLVVLVLFITVAILAIMSFLCVYFSVSWYLKMIWQWAQVKRRNRKKQTEELLDTLQFHAFISYSEHDSVWVKKVLIPNLEKEDGSIRICQHERNFVAGKSIIENIIDCIEKSYKSIFVLSPNFVQSEWCHYELYFAHHKLFSKNADNLILILLESIPAYIIPAKYHQLKVLMAKKTYLEWPKEKSKHGIFWANLRGAIHIELPVVPEMNELSIF